jgi:uncharacterized membrane protein
MDKERFLQKLRRRLRWRFSADETDDILADYGEFFLAGRAEGKSEQEICLELGAPAAIASDLARELQKKHPLRTQAIQRLLVPVLLLIIILSRMSSPEDYARSLALLLVIYGLTAATALLFARGAGVLWRRAQ